MDESEDHKSDKPVTSFAQKRRVLTRRERYLKVTLDWSLGIMSIGLGLFLLVLIFGKRLSVLDYLGIRSFFTEKAGVYAECDNPKNRNSPYCQPKQHNADKAWDTISRTKGKPLPFNLHRD